MSPSAPPWRVIRASRLLDGTGGAPLETPTVVLRGDTIHAVHAGPDPRRYMGPVRNLDRVTIRPRQLKVFEYRR